MSKLPNKQLTISEKVKLLKNAGNQTMVGLSLGTVCLLKAVLNLKSQHDDIRLQNSKTCEGQQMPLDSYFTPCGSNSMEL